MRKRLKKKKVFNEKNLLKALRKIKRKAKDKSLAVNPTRIILKDK